MLSKVVNPDITLLVRRRINWLIVGAVFGVAALTTWITREAAVTQLDIIRSALIDSGLDPVSGSCDLLDGKLNVTACLSHAGPNVDQTFVSSLLEQHSRVVESSTSTLGFGGLGFASRQSASMIGFVCLALLVVTHTTSPWEIGTGRSLIAAVGPRRFLAQKVTTLLGVVLMQPLVGWIGVIVGSIVPVKTRLPVASTNILANLEAYARAESVLITFGLILVALGVSLRAMVPTFVSVMILLGVAFLATLNRTLYPFTPASWIAAVMRFSADSHRQVVDSLWAPWVSSYLSSAAGFACLLILSAVLLVAAVWWLPRRRPIA